MPYTFPPGIQADEYGSGGNICLEAHWHAFTLSEWASLLLSPNFRIVISNLKFSRVRCSSDARSWADQDQNPVLTSNLSGALSNWQRGGRFDPGECDHGIGFLDVPEAAQFVGQESFIGIDILDHVLSTKPSHTTCCCIRPV
jgi:hypothetical protein